MTGKAPTPHELGLSANPEMTWEGIGIAEPTPADLFGESPDTTWEQFHAAHEAEAGE